MFSYLCDCFSSSNKPNQKSESKTKEYTPPKIQEISRSSEEGFFVNV